MSEPRDILRFPTAKRRLFAGVAIRWLTLLSFVAGTIGVPLEPSALWGQSGRASCAKRPGEPCRCSSVSRTLGTCCCKQGQATKSSAQAESASERRPEVPAVCQKQRRGDNAPRSCCANKPPKTATPTASATPKLAIEACPCGGSSPTPLLLLCGDPRVLPADVEIAVTTPAQTGLALFDLGPQGQRARPQVPPPKSLPV